MINEWSDRMAERDSLALWLREIDLEFDRRRRLVENELRQQLNQSALEPETISEALRNFVKLRDKLFPGLPTDPALKILATLAATPSDSDKATVTGIAYGADVPLTTALRYFAVMEADGIVERYPHPDDRRQVIIRLTDEGRRKLDAINEQFKSRLLLLLVVPGILSYSCRDHLFNILERLQVFF